MALRSSSLNVSFERIVYEPRPGCPQPIFSELARHRALFNRDTVQQTVRQRHQDDDLFGNGRRFEFRLFEDGAYSLAMVDDLASVFIEAGAELGEGFQLGELSVCELEIARNRSVGRPLRLASDPRHGLADIDSGKNPQLKKCR